MCQADVSEGLIEFAIKTLNLRPGMKLKFCVTFSQVCTIQTYLSENE